MILLGHWEGGESGHSINKTLRCNVDGVITDNPLYVECFIGKYDRNLLVEDIVELFYGPDGQVVGGE